MGGYNFTEGVLRALQAANTASATLGHEYVGPHHLMLGLLHDPDVAAFLGAHDVRAEQIEIAIAAIDTPGAATLPADEERPYTSRAQKSLQLAMVAAREGNHDHIGTLMVLLGILQEKMNIGAQVLAGAGVTAADVAAAIDGRSGK